MKNTNVLLVEDDPTMQSIVKNIVGEMCKLTIASSVAEARSAVKSKTFSLFILDVVLPDGDGFEFCKEIRNDESLLDVQIIFLTERTSLEDRLQGFALGADDYITKPVVPEEFLAKIKAKLRRVIAPPKTYFKKAHFHADLLTQRIIIKEGEQNQELNLTPIEFKLMVHFLNNEGKVFSRKTLVESIWGSATHISDHTVDTHISSLRKKIGPSAKYLKAIIKQGYCFTMAN